MSSKGRREKTSERTGARSAAEWATLALSVGIVVLILGLLVAQQFSPGPDEATLSAEILIDEVREADNSFYLPVKLINSGDRGATDVTVEVLESGESDPVAEIEINDIPGDSEREVVAVLEEEPGSNLRAVVTSFEQP